MGPTYCETLKGLSGFPLEPINTWSNLFIIVLGVVALVLIANRPIKRLSRGLWLLGALLTFTGIGSFLWHGWRTSAFLALDALPGGLFLLVTVYVWLRRFYSRWITLSIFTLFVGIEALALLLFRTAPLFVSIAPLIVILSAWLVARTYQEAPRAAALGGGALLLAVIALIFRSIDLPLCPTFPLGTHFLWHIFLSFGALVIILMLIILDYLRAPRRAERSGDMHL